MENEVFSFLITALGKEPDIVEDMSAFKINLRFEKGDVVTLIF